MTPSEVLALAADILDVEAASTSVSVFAAIHQAVGDHEHALWAASVELARLRAISHERQPLDLLGQWLTEKGRTREQILAMLRGQDWRTA